MVRININDDTVPDVDSIKVYMDELATQYIETTDGEHFNLVGIKSVTFTQTGDIIVLTMGQ